MNPSKVHIQDTKVIVECDTIRAAVELAERLIHAQPVAYIRLDGMRRLIIDPTQVTQAVGRSIASEDMIGLHPMPQASARKQALMEAYNMCATARSQSDQTALGCKEGYEQAVAFGAARQAEKLGEAIKKLIDQ
jgi:hypothetical protein